MSQKKSFPVGRYSAQPPDSFTADQDWVAIEEPLEIRVEGVAAAITMRSPGDDLDLAAGFLLTEGVIDGWDDVKALAMVAENVVDVRLAEGVPAARARRADRAMFASSSCGICGKASLDRLATRAGKVRGWLPDAVTVERLPALLESHQRTFRETGGTHAAGLFSGNGALLVAREDVGRHNAVDKVIGHHVRSEADFTNCGLIVSSRAGFEIVQKAVACGLGCAVTVGAPTSLAVQAAEAAGLVLIARHQGQRWVRYT